MKYKITWLSNGFVQVKELTNCKKKEDFFTMNSPIYKAIENGSFCIVGYGVHHFTAESLNEE